MMKEVKGILFHKIRVFKMKSVFLFDEVPRRSHLISLSSSLHGAFTRFLSLTEDIIVRRI
jgi:hypothetical protein